MISPNHPMNPSFSLISFPSRSRKTVSSSGSVRDTGDVAPVAGPG